MIFIYFCCIDPICTTANVALLSLKPLVLVHHYHQFIVSPEMKQPCIVGIEPVLKTTLSQTGFPFSGSSEAVKQICAGSEAADSPEAALQRMKKRVYGLSSEVAHLTRERDMLRIQSGQQPGPTLPSARYPYPCCPPPPLPPPPAQHTTPPPKVTPSLLLMLHPPNLHYLCAKVV